MNRLSLMTPVLVGVALAAAGCGGGGDGMMNGPGMLGPEMPVATGAPDLVSVTPAPGGTGAETQSAITIRFSHAMDDEMDQYVDLHEGDLSGPLVPMECNWSSDVTTLTCTPHAPLRSRTTYAIHVGGGMRDADGRQVDVGLHGLEMGGSWAQQGGFHGGMSWGMMGSGWRHPRNGSFGMVFVFETA